jgi:fatty acid desaturase
MGASVPAPQIAWRDLVPLSHREILIETILPLPWLVLSLYCYHRGWLIPGTLASFYLFLTGLRQSHGAQHYTLGLPRRAQDAVLFVLSVIMLGSMHAVQTSHLHHHRHCMEKSDSEGATAHLPWWQAILAGPRFLTGLHQNAWKLATARQRRWIAAELSSIFVFVAVSPVLPMSLQFHFSAMVLGECLTGFFAVWTVHHDCDASGTLARTQRGRWLNFFCFDMFYHAEHHLFAGVPTCHLHRLAARLDSLQPAYPRKQVLSWKFEREKKTAGREGRVQYRECLY